MSSGRPGRCGGKPTNISMFPTSRRHGSTGSKASWSACAASRLNQSPPLESSTEFGTAATIIGSPWRSIMNGCSAKPGIPARTAAAVEGAVNPTAVTAPTPTMQTDDFRSAGLFISRPLSRDLLALRVGLLSSTTRLTAKSFLIDPGLSQFGHLWMTRKRRVPDQDDARYVGFQNNRMKIRAVTNRFSAKVGLKSQNHPGKSERERAARG